MELKTKHFGTLVIDENKIIQFEHGIPGFLNNKRFILLEDSDQNNILFRWLQSTEDGNICFVLVDTFKILPNYNPLVNEEELECLGKFTVDQLEVYNIAVVPQNIEKMTLNLKAPVVINPTTKKGVQVIVNNDEYAIKYYIMEDIKRISG